MNTPSCRHRSLLAYAFGAVLCAGCDQGSITLSVTDAPADEVNSVVVRFEAVEFERSSGEWERIELDDEPQLDLLALRGGRASTLIHDENLPSGQYRAIRFAIVADGNGLDSYVDEADGRRVALELEGGADQRPGVDFRFDLDEGESVSITVDFDLRASLIEPESLSDSYVLDSSLRAVDDELVGRVVGSVAASLLSGSCSPALYVYEGEDAETGDLGSESAPLTSLGLTPALGASGVDYSIGFLEAGDYSIAFTCEADADDPLEDEAVDFRRERNFEIEEGQEARVDLQ